ncbi:MAG: DUF2344 domain-containing protein [Clostridiaceae bacterium]|nr:DUF2344 domain-containing protein [Clostridiaceae bacterium]
MAKTIRFCFSRGSELKYLSHLDVLRVFERALKRSQIPVDYSEGFNPRMKLVFGLPMSTGLTSEAEYADITLERDMNCEDFISILNNNMPQGIKIHKAVELSIRDNIMNQIKAALYSICIETKKDEDKVNGVIDEILSQDELSVMKKTKRGLRSVNIRPLIYSLNIEKKDNNIIEIKALLSAGAEKNLRADLLMEAFVEKCDFDVNILSIHRKALYTSALNEWKNPLEVVNG